MSKTRFSYMFLYGLDFNNIFSEIQLGCNSLFDYSVSYIEDNISDYTKELSPYELEFIEDYLVELDINIAVFSLRDNLHCVLSNLFTPNNIHMLAEKFFSINEDLFCLVFSQNNQKNFNLSVYKKQLLLSKIDLTDDGKYLFADENCIFEKIFKKDKKQIEDAIIKEKITEKKNELSSLLNLPLNLTYNEVSDNIENFNNGLIYHF